MRQAIREIDPNVPIPAMKTMSEIVSASVAQRRFQLFLILLFAALALTLALVGIYGVISYSVVQQTGEIGLRIALGAMPRQLFRSVLIQGLTPVLAGLAFGLTAAVAAAHFLRGLLFGVGFLDPLSLIGVTILVLLASAAACFLPARHAARLDPMTALRWE